MPHTDPTDSPIRVAVIVGSTRRDRFGPVPARWITAEIDRRDDLVADLVDLAEVGCPTELPGDDDEPLPASVAALGARLALADAIVIVTPVYNRGYPASVKNAIDWFVREWMAKPVGFVGYGGHTGGLTAVEQLRQVMAEFHTVTLAEPILFRNFWDEFDEAGRPVRAEHAAARAETFLDQLTWWSTALRAARARRPYPVAVPA